MTRVLVAILALLLLGLLLPLLAAPAALGLLSVFGEEPPDPRRGRFIPEASRTALDEMASDIRKLRVRRRAGATTPAYGRVDLALHQLLGILPYPSEPEERELMEDALRCLESCAPDVARALAERMRAHYLGTHGGAAHA